MKRLKKYMIAGLDLLLPRRCVVCGRRLYVNEAYLCLYCSSDIPFTRYWKLNRNPMADKFNALIQNRMEILWDSTADNGAALVREHYAYACALFFFGDEAGYKHILHEIKYNGNLQLGENFGRMLGTRLKEATWAGNIDMVLPVPLHWRRRWSRGYNQAAVIAAQVAQVLNAPTRTDILRRTRHTGTQTKMSVYQKTINMKGAFEAALPDDAEGIRHVLIIDDVFTTGNTLLACFIALREVFPQPVRISVATLAFVGRA